MNRFPRRCSAHAYFTGTRGMRVRCEDIPGHPDAHHGTIKVRAVTADGRIAHTHAIVRWHEPAFITEEAPMEQA